MALKIVIPVPRDDQGFPLIYDFAEGFNKEVCQQRCGQYCGGDLVCPGPIPRGRKGDHLEALPANLNPEQFRDLRLPCKNKGAKTERC